MLQYSKFVNTKAFQKAGQRRGHVQVPVFSKSVPFTKLPKNQDASQSETAQLSPETVCTEATTEQANTAANAYVPRNIHASVDLDEMQRQEELTKKDQDWLGFFLGVGHSSSSGSNDSYVPADFAAGADVLSNTQVFADETIRAAIGVNSICTALVPLNKANDFAKDTPKIESSVYEEKASGAPSQSLSELISSLFESAVSSTASELTSAASDSIASAAAPSDWAQKPEVSPALLSSLQATVCAAAAELAKTTSGSNMTFDDSNKASLAVTLPDMLAVLPRAKQSLPNPALSAGPHSLNEIFNEMISDDKVFKRVCG